MPYISEKDKYVYAVSINMLAENFASVGAGDGDLNYVLTAVALAWMKYHQPPWGYALRSDVIKAFESAKLEFYRRVLVPYEDQKIIENGDVYKEE